MLLEPHKLDHGLVNNLIKLCIVNENVDEIQKVNGCAVAPHSVICHKNSKIYCVGNLKKPTVGTFLPTVGML